MNFSLTRDIPSATAVRGINTIFSDFDIDDDPSSIIFHNNEGSQNIKPFIIESVIENNPLLLLISLFDGLPKSLL